MGRSLYCHTCVDVGVQAAFAHPCLAARTGWVADQSLIVVISFARYVIWGDLPADHYFAFPRLPDASHWLSEDNNELRISKNSRWKRKRPGRDRGRTSQDKKRSLSPQLLRNQSDISTLIRDLDSKNSLHYPPYWRVYLFSRSFLRKLSQLSNDSNANICILTLCISAYLGIKCHQFFFLIPTYKTLS